MKPNPLKLAVIILTAVSLVSTSAAIYYYRQYKQFKANPKIAADEEVSRLRAEVGQLMVLPDETPTVATVTDPEKLKGQAFFKDAKVGDKVLIFTKANKAVLYDPVAKKILETAPINNAAPAEAPAASDAK